MFWQAVHDFVKVFLAELVHCDVGERADGRVPDVPETEHGNVPEVRPRAYLSHHPHPRFVDGHVALLQDVHVCALVPFAQNELVRDVILGRDAFRHEVHPGHDGVRVALHEVLEVLAEEGGVDDDVPRDLGHDFVFQVVRQLVRQALLGEVHLAREPHAVVEVPHLGLVLLAEVVLVQELVHGVDLRPVVGPLLPPSVELLQRGDDGTQDESREAVADDDLPDDGRHLLRRLLRVVAVPRVGGPVEAVDVEDELVHGGRRGRRVDPVVDGALHQRVSVIRGHVEVQPGVLQAEEPPAVGVHGVEPHLKAVGLGVDGHG
mmetsp:Transcript_7009/g.19874  ORF Transcript_7009/g.19874 Transcript_7009/m.19874 type:complete len:318 (+) Transcript_7009:424-1377(+)